MRSVRAFPYSFVQQQATLELIEVWSEVARTRNIPRDPILSLNIPGVLEQLRVATFDSVPATVRSEPRPLRRRVQLSSY